MHPFPFDVMRERREALERLDLHIRWGHYEIRVLRFHLTTFGPGKTVGFHQHSEFEFHFIPRGRGKVAMGGREFDLSAGMFYLTGPGVMHYQEAHLEEAMDELCLHIDIVDRTTGMKPEDSLAVDRWEAADSRLCMERLHKLPLVPTMDTYGAMSCFLEAYQACIANTVGSYTTIKQSVLQIVLRAVRAYEMGDEPVSLPSRDLQAIRYRLALQYIRANYAGVVTLEDLADKLNISSRQLQRILKTYHDNGSFSSIVEDVRLEAVCRQLKDTAHSVEKIAVSEGFANGNYLHAVFRKRFGMTPSEYRKREWLHNGEDTTHE
ncbi:AraC family transcriptional regulator [Paenibacillus sp. ACRRX]|uniref:AraC family transcriptional regulator n=1 Tax=Paenibacillus sp. ACRRX TaxID=2918206 RepID=UPI001EF5403C|nr:AraC family transcriptional regulator [Paenibacillus sp. ACRRX]MCG7409630.1 AraC family transcriptional regulator [Paenibacillus sp. ACRRX]